MEDIYDVGLYFSGSRLIVEFGEARDVVMELSKEDAALTKVVLADPNFWANFLGALSAAVTKHK